MNLFNLLGDYFQVPSGDYKFLAEIVTFLNQAVLPITIVLTVAASVLSVVIGFCIMKAESSDKAKEMKKRLWGLIITVICVVGGVWLLGILLSGDTMTSIIDRFRGIQLPQ